MRINPIVVMTAFVLSPLFLPPASAADEIESKHVSKFEINPVAMDAKDSTGTVLGLEYSISGVLVTKPMSGEEGSQIDPDALISALNIEYKANGTLAVDQARNPKDFLETRVSGTYLRSQKQFTLKIGGFAAFESDQSFDNSQAVYGLTTTIGKLDFLTNKNDFVALSIDLAQVDPKGDDIRKAALGRESDTYYRWSAEFLYQIPIKQYHLDAFEFDYRYFKENAPPPEIRAADLDRFKLATYRLGFENNLFIAYSSGALPFDKAGERIFEIGLTYKLK